MNSRRKTVCGALLVLCGMAQAEQGTGRTVTLNIDAPTMAKALIQFTQQSGLQLIFPTDGGAARIPAPKLAGIFTPEAALEKLLSNSGLKYQYINPHTIAVSSSADSVQRPIADASPMEVMQLVQAEALSPAAQGEGEDKDRKSPPADSPSIQEVIVTAQKREERLQDVPFAITAISQQEIGDRGSIDIKALQYSVPGLNIQELFSGGNRTTLRGITPGGGSGLPIVGIYVDDVGISADQQQRDGIFPLVDIERIEVLRGPQGTLYGQGSIAGTIRYITRNPDLAKSDGFIEANVYDQETGSIGYRVNGAVGVPLVAERVGLRLSGGYDHIAGWIDYPAANIKDANDIKRIFIRPKLYARLTDQLTFTLLYQYYDQKGESDPNSGVISPSLRPGRTRLYPGTDQNHLVGAIFSYDVGPATLLSSTGYQYRDLLFQVPISIFDLDAAVTEEQFNQELRISSNGDGPIKYTAGAWYRKFLSKIDQTLFDSSGAATAVGRILGDSPVDSESKAVFGDATYSATERLDLSLGARYYWDERQSITVIPPLNEKATFSNFNPRFSMKYSWMQDMSTYLTVSKGFRSGGFNATGTSFGPEALWNYEIGTKTSLLGGALFIDLAAYYIDYSDRQTQSLVPIGSGVFNTETRTSGKASGAGLEGSINALLGAGLRLDATAGYNNVKSDVNTVEVLKGERFGQTPAFTGSISLSQRTPVSAILTGMWRIDYQHSDPYSYISRLASANGTVTTTQNFNTKPQDYLNLRVGVETQQMGIYLDAQNILNEDAILFPFSPIASTQEGVRSRPRSYGVTLRLNF